VLGCRAVQLEWNLVLHKSTAPIIKVPEWATDQEKDGNTTEDSLQSKTTSKQTNKQKREKTGN
jgi:hypothetical protein